MTFLKISYLFLAALGLCCDVQAGAALQCGARASLIVEHRL